MDLTLLFRPVMNAKSKNEFGFLISVFSWLKLLWFKSIGSCCKEVGTKNSLASLKQVERWRSRFSEDWWLASVYLTIHSSWVFRHFLQRFFFARRQRAAWAGVQQEWGQWWPFCCRGTSGKLL